MSIRGRRRAAQEALSEVVEAVEHRAEDVGEAVRPKTRTPLLARLVLGLLKLVVGLVRAVLAAVLGAVGGLVGGVGGAVHGLTSGVRAVLVGAARVISPRSHKKPPAGDGDGTGEDG